MAGFQFKLQAVLQHRQMIEDECQRELAKHLRARMIYENELRQMQHTISDSKAQLGSGLVGKVDLDSIAGFARYSGHVAVRAQQIVVRMAQLEKQTAAARERMLDAVRQRKALELLRDKQHRQWREEQQRRETIELDEVATQRYMRNRAMEGAR